MRSRILYYIHLKFARASLWILAFDAWLDGACCFEDALTMAAMHMKECIGVGSEEEV